MMRRRVRPIRRATLWVAAAILATPAACRQASPPVIAPPPSLPAQQPMSVTTEVTTTTSSPVPADTAAEQRVTIDTHGGEMDVRQALAFIAEQGKLSLIVSPKIDKKVRLQLNDVPVSQALKTVLDAAGLTLENLNATPAPERTSSVVFYQLPVNIDSLSVDAIMKRFGVGRTAAELMVQQRTVRP
jgi:hypothetical protein